MIAIVYATTGQPFVEKKTNPKKQMPTDGFKIEIKHEVILYFIDRKTYKDTYLDKVNLS